MEPTTTELERSIDTLLIPYRDKRVEELEKRLQFMEHLAKHAVPNRQRHGAEFEDGHRGLKVLPAPNQPDTRTSANSNSGHSSGPAPIAVGGSSQALDFDIPGECKVCHTSP